MKEIFFPLINKNSFLCMKPTCSLPTSSPLVTCHLSKTSKSNNEQAKKELKLHHAHTVCKYKNMTNNFCSRFSFKVPVKCKSWWNTLIFLYWWVLKNKIKIAKALNVFVNTKFQVLWAGLNETCCVRRWLVMNYEYNCLVYIGIRTQVGTMCGIKGNARFQNGRIRTELRYFQFCGLKY